MPAYVDIAAFKQLSVIPSAMVDQLEALEPGWLDSLFSTISALADARLSKRVQVPLQQPYSPTVVGIIVRIATLDALLKLGVPADDQQVQLVAQQAQAALADLKELADGQLSLLDLGGKDRVSYGGVLSYSEASPYAHHDVESERGRREDQSRRGGSGWPT